MGNPIPGLDVSRFVPPKEPRGEKVGGTAFHHWTRQGQCSPPNLGSRASVIGHAFNGQTVIDAVVAGEINIPPAFVFSTASLYLEVTARVLGGIRFETATEGSVGGELLAVIGASVEGSFLYRNEGRPGGLARKRVLLFAAVQGDLTALIQGKGNYHDFDLVIPSMEAGSALLRCETCAEMRIAADTINEAGDRVIVISDQ